MRVRIVDDEAGIAQFLSIALGMAHLEVAVTNSAFETLLAPAPWEGVDAAVVDLMLGPGVQGESILRYLQAAHPEIRRVVLSASQPVLAHLENEDPYLAHAWLLKPTTTDDLLTALGVENGSE